MSDYSGMAPLRWGRGVMHLHHHQQQQSLMHFAYVTSSFLNIYLIIGCLHTSIDALFYISFILIVFFFSFFAWISINGCTHYSNFIILHRCRCSGYAFSIIFAFKDCEKHCNLTFIDVFIINALLDLQKNNSTF